MMNKEELKNEIMKTKKQLETLQIALSTAEETEKEVPETLDIYESNKYYFVNGTGNVEEDTYNSGYIYDVERLKRHRAFLSEEYAKKFADKSQFIADLLHFKYLYDKDYEPNWNSSDEPKYRVYYNNKTKKFDWYYTVGYSYMIESVYFSTDQVVKKCVDWLNKKYN